MINNILTRKKCGGKGNSELFIERDTKICAAGLPTRQPEQHVKDNLNNYSVQDEVEALISDAVEPLFKTADKLPLRRNETKDMRNSSIFSEGSTLINPVVKTKFQTLAEDFKETTFNSYWNKEIGKVPDPVPSLPRGFKTHDITAGKKTQLLNNLYEVIMPANAVPDTTPRSKEPGYQRNRNYDYFDSNAVFGKKSHSDSSGKLVKNCLTNNNLLLGNALKVPISKKQAHFQDATSPKLAVTLTPNNNIYCVPKGFTFGKLKISDDNRPEFLRTYEMNSSKELLNKCLEHLNTLRNSLSKRFDGLFFKRFYLNLKWLDDTTSGWLKKEIIYEQCNMRYIKFNSFLIEPLLQIWNAFNGSHIEYKIFIRVINFREPTPELPKINGTLEKVINVYTTYEELTKNKHTSDKYYKSGIMSEGYVKNDNTLSSNGFYNNDRSYFLEEMDMKACLSPSIFTLLGISHHDMYAKQEPNTIKKIFENAGERFHDKKFNDIWEIAEKCHSQKWVCLETFRHSIIEYEMKN